MITVKLVYTDDWAGLYINGILKAEGHEITFENGFNIVCKEISDKAIGSYIKFDSIHVDYDWMEKQGSLPNKFEDIPDEVLYQ